MISEELQKLINTKAAIKLALVDKGQIPTDEFASYADNIRAIETGGGGDFDFSVTGYNDFLTPKLSKGLEDALTLYNQLNGTNLGSLANKYQNNSIMFYPKITGTFTGTSATTTTSGGINYMFSGAVNLRSADLSNLTTVGTTNTTKYASLNSAFLDCTSLIKVKLPNVFINNMASAFYRNHLLESIDFNHSIVDSTATKFVLNYAFYNCRNLKEILNAENIDISNTSEALLMFYICEKLESIPFTNLHFTTASNLSSMFDLCKALKNIPDITADNATSISSLCQYCTALLKAPNIVADKATQTTNVFTRSGITENGIVHLDKTTAVNNFYQYCESMVKFDGSKFTAPLTTIYTSFLYGCSNLTRIENFNISKATSGFSSSNNCVYNSKKVKYMHLIGLGTPSATTAYYLYYNASYPRYWGINDEEVPDAYDSVYYTLVRDSYDRAANGMSKCTIHLSSNTANVITAEDMAAISAKGYTITTH